jgi:RNA polymerase sigma-70 factor (ECF subfamily)
MGRFQSESDPAGSAAQALDRDALHRALWSLSDEQRTVVALVELAGFSTSEAARIMATPRGTVLSRLHRARKALALTLRDEVRDQEDLER